MCLVGGGNSRDYNCDECSAFSYGNNFRSKYQGHPLTDVAFWDESIPAFEQHWNESHLR
jgi:hypothetical protein